MIPQLHCKLFEDRDHVLHTFETLTTPGTAPGRTQYELSQMHVECVTTSRHSPPDPRIMILASSWGCGALYSLLIHLTSDQVQSLT